MLTIFYLTNPDLLPNDVIYDCMQECTIYYLNVLNNKMKVLKGNNRRK